MGKTKIITEKPAVEARNRAKSARFAAFLLRWAMIKDALPATYVVLAKDRLHARGITGIPDSRIYSCKNDGNERGNETILEVFEELAKQYHPDKIASEEQARAFLSTWEQRPGRRVRALVAA